MPKSTTDPAPAITSSLRFRAADDACFVDIEEPSLCEAYGGRGRRGLYQARRHLRSSLAETPGLYARFKQSPWEFGLNSQGLKPVLRPTERASVQAAVFLPSALAGIRWTTLAAIHSFFL